MATYFATARSNYFRVRDEAAFRAAMAEQPVEVIRGAEGRLGLLSSYESGWPAWGEDEDGNDVEIDFAEEIAPHLADGEVAVLMEVGNEKMRYLNGVARAINNKGEQVVIDLEQIYEQAQALGSGLTRCEF